MSDEKFHLTPIDVRRKEFRTALRGYDRADVELFRDQVADELERLTRLNQDLESRARGFSEQLKGFRERDKALNEALISAQQLRAETREQAEREAQLILREARAEGERLAEGMRAELRRLRDEISVLERARRAYLAQLRTLIERQLAEIEVAEQTPPPNAAPSAEGESGGRAVPHQTPAWLDSLLRE